MTYTVILKDGTAFQTEYYSYDNNWNEDAIFMIIKANKYSTNGKDFVPMEEDHL